MISEAPVGLQQFIAAVAIVLIPTDAYPQVLQVKGGASTLFRVHGGSVRINGGDYLSEVGFGYLSGLMIGGSIQTNRLGYDLKFGDDAGRFRLPTDIFNGNSYFGIRGITASHSGKDSSLFLFGGTTTTQYGLPFLRAAESDRGVAGVFFDRRLGSDLNFVSRNIISREQTFLQGIDWTPNSKLAVSTVGGVGANSPYAATGMKADTGRVKLKLGYIHASDRFRRMVIRSPLVSEPTRENAEISVNPISSLTLSAGRANRLTPLVKEGGSLAVTVNRYGGSYTIAGLLLSASHFESWARGIHTSARTYSASRNITRRVDGRVSLFRTLPDGRPSTGMATISVREKVSQRLSLMQTITHTNGRRSINFGGEFLSNRIRLGLHYNTYYVPARALNPFQQALSVRVGFQLPGNARINVSSNVSPDGTIRYTAWGEKYLYPGSFGPGPSSIDSIPDYIVRGIVQDVLGGPFAGAAIEIGDSVVYSDPQGAFFVRLKRRGPHRLRVKLADFLVFGVYEVVKAPSQVTASTEEDAEPIVIRIRRAARQQLSN